MFNLDGHVAVVTGGSSGIGLGMATGLAKAGAKIAIWGRSEAKAVAAAAGLRELGTEAHGLTCDVSDEEQIAAATAKTLEHFGRIDSCFANAGTNAIAPGLAATELEQWNDVVGVNLTGVFLSFRAAARHMIERGGGGRLVATSSIGARLGMPKTPHYAAAKAGLCALVRSAAVDLARHSITANAILPGWIETPMLQPFKEGGKWEALTQNIIPRTPLRRWGQPDDFEAIAVYFASDGSRFQTGDVVTLDGGYCLT